MPPTDIKDLPARLETYTSTQSQWFTVAVLCFVNLINYMDRFTIAGVLTDIQNDFNIADDYAGLLQTAFILSYMVTAPIFGYLGDRYSRRWLMVVGITLWSTTTLVGSFMHNFGAFIALRALVGIGEASYSTIAPTSISDLFVHKMRSKMLAVFYFAIPVGSGLGYVVGSKTAALAGNWRWALRVTPCLGIIAVVLILLTKDPKRGESEGAHDLAATSYIRDIKDLTKNSSYLLTTAGFTCLTFVTGALAWWGPTFIQIGFSLQPDYKSVTLEEVSFKFGFITMFAGILGVPLGSILSQVLIKRFPRVDPLLCALGMFISIPLFVAAMIIVSKNSAVTYVLVFFGQLSLNISWAIIADMLMYVVVPIRRSTAEAFQILFAHALGDAISPYLVGVLSEILKKYIRSPLDRAHTGLSGISTRSLFTEQDTTWTKFKALQYALLSTSLVEVMGGIFFLLTASFIVKDRKKAVTAASVIIDIQDLS